MNNVSKGIMGDILPKLCGAVQNVAAGGNDGVAVTGITIDTHLTLAGLGGQGKDLVAKVGSIMFAVFGEATLTDTKTLSLACEYQTSEDGSTWNTAVSLRASSVWKTATASTTYNLDTLYYALSTESLPRYVRFNFTADLNHSGTDTATLVSAAILGNANAGPIS